VPARRRRTCPDARTAGKPPGVDHAACGQRTRYGDNSWSAGQEAAADGVLREEDEDALLSFLVDPELDEPDEASEEVLLLDEDASLFAPALASPFGTAPARLSVR
jgi:hypothetical protein